MSGGWTTTISPEECDSDDSSIHSDSNMKDAVDWVLSGKVTSLPKQPSNVVKIYISSTNEDFVHERQRLWEETLPELQRYLLGQGVEVQFVDVHQAARFDHAYNRRMFDRHLELLKHCYKESMGIFFICLVGNRHGVVPLPSHIDEQEYKAIKEEAVKNGKDIKLLEKWYAKDYNAIPPAYVLRPIGKRYPALDDGSYTKNSKHLEAELSEWQFTFSQLHEILQHGAEVYYRSDPTGQAQKHKQQRFFMSTVEQEVQQALEKSISSCLLFVRSFDNMGWKGQAASVYADIKNNGDMDLAAQQRNKTFREIICNKLNDENQVTFHVAWRKDGLTPSTFEPHAEYLEQFHAAVIAKVTGMIERHMQQRINNIPVAIHANDATHMIYNEVLTHARYHRKITRSCKARGFEEIEESVKQTFIKCNQLEHKLVIIQGQEASGKTVLLSRILSWAMDVLGPESLVVLRYIGLTPVSSSENNLLMSICCQLEYNLNGTVNCSALKLDGMVRHFEQLLQCYSKLCKNVVIVLDGIHSINGNAMLTKNMPYLGWLFIDLPPCIHLVATTTNNAKQFPWIEDILKKAKSLDYNFEFPRHNENSFHQMLKDGFASTSRKVTTEQESMIMDVIRDQGRPFKLKLCIDEALLWPSFAATDGLSSKFASTEDIALKHRFDKLEEKYGQKVIAQVSLYLATSYTGISETEFLDVLSCNNEIIQLLFQHKNIHSNFTVLRFPSNLWWALRTDLGCCLSEKFLDGKKLLTWSHGMIAQTALQRYHPTVDDTKQAHCDFADLFLETWLGNKPLVNPEKGIEIIDTGNRYVSYQPLLFSDTSYNRRRINALWYHILHSGDQTRLKEHSFLNFEYLLATLHSTSIFVLLDDLQVALTHILDADLKLVLHSLLYGQQILSHDPLQLAVELIGNLRQIKEFSPPHMESLVQQCMEWCDSFTLPLLVPLSTWFPDPRADLVTSFYCDQGRVDHLCITSNYQHLFCSTKRQTENTEDGTPECKVLMYHVASSRLVKQFTGFEGYITCMTVLHKNQTLICGSTDSSMYMWDISSGNLNQLRLHEDAVLCCTLSKQNDFLITGSTDKSFRVTAMATLGTVHHVDDQEGEVTCVLVTNGDTMLVTACGDCLIKVWYMEDMTLLSCIDSGIPSAVCALALSPDNTFLILGCVDSSVIVKALTTGSDIHTLEGMDGQATVIAVSDDSKHCTIGCSDGGVYTFNFRTKSLLHKHTHTKAQYFTEDLEIINHVSCLEISEDEHFIFSACDDEIAVWTFYKETSNILTQDEHTDIVTCIGISIDGKIALTGSRDCTVKMWNLDIPDYMATWEGHTGQVTCLSIAEDNTFAVSGSEDTTVKVWSIVLGSVITDFMAHTSSITQVCAMRESSQVLSAEEDGCLKIWIAETGDSVWNMEADVRLCEISPSLTHVVSGDMEQYLTVWTMCDGHPVGNRLNHNDCITCASYSADSQLLVTGSADCSLKVWEVYSAKLIQVLVEHEGMISSAVITAGNQYVVSASFDKRVLVWSLTTGTVEHQLLGHTKHVMCVKVTLDGTIALTGSRDGTLRVWNILRGTPVTVFDMHAPVFSLHITGHVERVVVQLEGHCAVPLMCLHNSPSGEVKSQSDIDIHLTSEQQTLPLKPKPVASHRPNTIYALPKKKREHDRPPSVSTIPEIIEVSPIKAPTLQKAVKAQEVNQEKRIAVCRELSSISGASGARVNRTKSKPKTNSSKNSSFCQIL